MNVNDFAGLRAFCRCLEVTAYLAMGAIAVIVIASLVASCGAPDPVVFGAASNASNSSSGDTGGASSSSAGGGGAAASSASSTTTGAGGGSAGGGGSLGASSSSGGGPEPCPCIKVEGQGVPHDGWHCGPSASGYCLDDGSCSYGCNVAGMCLLSGSAAGCKPPAGCNVCFVW